MESLETLKRIAANPSGYAIEWKEKQKGAVVGTFCSYVPEEILLAGGVLGYRIFGSGREISLADAHMQAYSCSLARGALEDELSGRLAFLDGVVFPHTCDTIQRLSDIWRMNIKDRFHLDLVLPVKLDTDSAREYMGAVLEKFRKDLESALGKRISESDLKRAVDICNRIRETMGRIYALRQKQPACIRGEEVHAMVKAAMTMDRREFLPLAEDVAGELERNAVSNDFPGKRIVLSGGLCNMPDLYRMIEDAGGAVVADDLCTGSRFFDGVAAHAENSIKAVAERLVNRNICPAKHSGIRSRGENLVGIVRESRADGVIFAYLKFCDPHSFDYPYLKEMLEAEGVPCMLVELEEQAENSGQFQTRCEAFIEMLGN